MPKRKFIQKAIKRKGRLRRLLNKRPGETITEEELDMLERRARSKGDKSLLEAVLLARRLKSGKFRGKIPGRPKAPRNK